MNNPFLKWAGGKYRLLPELKKHFPFKINKFVEPFVGAGSVFLNMEDSSEEILINDINRDLISVWSTLKIKKEEFIQECENLFGSNTERDYYKLREEFNQTKSPALFVYLNRHCFNGLCRFNKKGEFNVPFGKYKNVYFPRKEMEKSISILQKTFINSGDFSEVMCQSEINDLIYLDPPYVPLSDTSYFTNYSPQGFGLDDQLRLFQHIVEATKRGSTVIISNHDTPFTRDLYCKAKIYSIDVRRSISCKGDKREMVKEIIAIFSPN